MNTEQQGILKRIYHAAINKPSAREDRKDDPANMQNDTAVYESFSTFLQGGFERLVNPDRLVRNKGAKIYNKMLLDDQVAAAFNLKLNIIISRKMRFEETAENQQEIVKFFERNIQDLISGTWLQALRTILMGKAYGYSISEKIFREAEIDGKLRWIIHKINPKPYDSFVMDVDKWGNLKAIRQDIEGRGLGGKKLNMDKFIIYVNKPEIDPIWGQSDLKPAYASYWYKDITNKYWAIYLERSAGGFITVSPGADAGNLQESVRTDLEKTIKNITGKTGILLPKGYEAKIVMHDETEAFQHRIEYADKQTARSILIPNLLGFSEQGKVGSYSQSQTQLDVFMMLIREEGEYLADILNEQLFSQLAWWNFGVREYPRAVFDEFTAEQKRLMAEIWIKATKEGAVTNLVRDEIQTRQYLKYPIPDEKELEKKEPETPTTEKIENSQKLTQKNGHQTKVNTQQSQGDQAKDESGSSVEGTFSDIPNNNEPKARSNVPVSEIRLEEHKVNHQQQSDTKVTFVDRIDFDKTGATLDDIEDNFITGMSNGVDIAYDEIKEAIAEQYKKIPKDRENINWDALSKALNKAVSGKTKGLLKKSITSSLKSTYNLGWNTSHKATKRAAEEANAPDKFISRINSVALLSERRICVEEEWTFVHFIEGLSLEMADGWFDSQAFKITGDLTQSMIDDAITIMREGILDEWSVRQITNELGEVLSPLLGTTRKAERARLETIARTNMSTIFTQSQLAFYNDPGLNGFVEALEYSAILDSRTTAVCNRLNGSIYRIGNSIWKFVTPPNHFNCRSVMLPVTVLDKWKEDKSSFNENQLPSKGFGRTGLAQMMDITLTK